MITLALLKYLEDNGVGKIDQDLFWEKLGLDKVGIYITSTGVSRNRGERRRQDYTIYSRGTADVSGYEKLEQVHELLDNSYDVCKLPAAPPALAEGYENVTIMPPASISNIGVDANGRVIWSFAGTIYY